MTDYIFLFNNLLSAKHKLSEKLTEDFPNDVELWIADRNLSDKIGALYTLLKRKNLIGEND